jgi:hypothetical protein
VFFGVLVYVNGMKKVFILLLVLLIMGPSIILYLPIWLAGVFCFKAIKTFELSLSSALILCLLSVIGIIVFSIESLQNEINTYAHHIIGFNFIDLLLDPADKFFSDYVLTIFVALHIFSSYHLINNFNIFNKRLETIIRELSSHTFSLYLFHIPMLYFVSAIIPYKSNPEINLIASWIVVPLLIYGLSCYTEKKRLFYKSFFSNIQKFNFTK